MRTSPKGTAFIAAHEGVVTRAYRDPTGTWTIGVGHTAAAGEPTPAPGMTISRERALAILASDLARFEGRVNAALSGGGNLAQQAFDGAVSFDFNTGAIDRANWVGRFRAGDMTAARAGLMEWAKAGGRTLPGLVRRREDEARLIFDGDYGSEGAQAGGNAGEDTAGVQRQLARFGYYTGAIDGIDGPATEAAIRAYQSAHPDLVVDGIAGTATRAALTRDVAARDRQMQTGLGGTIGFIAACVAWITSGARPGLAIAGATAAIAITVAAAFAWRYRGEIARALAAKFRISDNQKRKD